MKHLLLSRGMDSPLPPPLWGQEREAALGGGGYLTHHVSPCTSNNQPHFSSSGARTPRAHSSDLTNTGKVLPFLTGSSQLTNLLRNRRTAAVKVPADARGSQPPLRKTLLCSKQPVDKPRCPCKRQGPPCNKWDFYIPARTYYKLCAGGSAGGM